MGWSGYFSRQAQAPGPLAPAALLQIVAYPGSPLRNSLPQMLTHVINGSVPTELRKYVYGAKLIALIKKDKAIRLWESRAQFFTDDCIQFLPGLQLHHKLALAARLFVPVLRAICTAEEATAPLLRHPMRMMQTHFLPPPTGSLGMLLLESEGSAGGATFTP